MTDAQMTPEENTYHNLGLIAELLSVGSFKFELSPHIAIAINFIQAERNKYESSIAPRTEEQAEGQEGPAQADSNDPGETNPGDVPQAR